MLISMTENGDPLENAVAERVNGILKEEWLNREHILSAEDGGVPWSVSSLPTTGRGHT